jgi:ABC-type histidine transport system ATPase subunit
MVIHGNTGSNWDVFAVLAIVYFVLCASVSAIGHAVEKRAEMIHEVLEVIQELVEASMTTLLVTHEPNFAARVAHSVVFMDHGQIVEQGAPEVVLRNPREERTQAFLSKVLPGAR